MRYRYRLAAIAKESALTTTSAVEPITFGDICAEMARDRRVSSPRIAERVGLKPWEFSRRLNSDAWAERPNQAWAAQVLQAIEEEIAYLDAGRGQ